MDRFSLAANAECVRGEIIRKQSGSGHDNGGSQRLETGGLYLRNRDGCGDVDGRDGGSDGLSVT